MKQDSPKFILKQAISSHQKNKEAIELLDYPSTVRAEELSPEQFFEFYRVIVGEK